MAAGLGTRLRPLTERYAKPVLPIDGQPVVAQPLRELAAAGCRCVTVANSFASAASPAGALGAFQAAIDAGEQIAAVEIGPTRDLTAPLDVLEENFSYLSSL